MSNQDDFLIEQKLREMAKLSLLNNKINPIQEKNLKMFPLVFFNDVKEVKIDYDLTNLAMINTEEDAEKVEINYKIGNVETKHFRVSYHVTLDEANNTNLEKRFEALKVAVRNLFWNNIKVEVFFNEKLVYTSSEDGKKQ